MLLCISLIWGIYFTVVDQRPNEILVTLSTTYHQGFGTGYTLAEAINCAHESWESLRYLTCSTQCTKHPITKKLMVLPNQQGEFGDDEPSRSAIEDAGESDSPPSGPSKSGKFVSLS